MKSGSINVLEQIGTHYWELGVLLLDDTTGEVTQAIIEHHQLVQPKKCGHKGNSELKCEQ